MNVDELSLRDSPEGVSVGVRVQPRAGRNKIVGIHDGCLKIAIAAAPVEGEATRQCQRFLADVLDIAFSRVGLVAGAQSRNKVFRIGGMNATECRRILESLA
ncbi:MAG TPA: DUF167 domain-containing protein [Negativicutes bacterium]|nr:DUF167 domain-containing protein [Negativicutes bacterium]